VGLFSCVEKQTFQPCLAQFDWPMVEELDIIILYCLKLNSFKVQQLSCSVSTNMTGSSQTTDKLCFSFAVLGMLGRYAR